MRIRSRLLFTLALSGMLVTALDAHAQAERIEGVATVVDGDTLDFAEAGERVRLYGIDAPEGGQTCEDAAGKRYRCGSEAAKRLAKFVGRSGSVTCLWNERDGYGRPVAECVTSDNTVLNAAMVKTGWAVVFQRFSDGRYDQEEVEARAAKSGLWAGHFLQPARWRDENRRASERVEVSQPGGCPIKGNISRSNRIYHSPGQENYAKTQINEAAGERWFCSAEEAEAAGWRAAKQ